MLGELLSEERRSWILLSPAGVTVKSLVGLKLYYSSNYWKKQFMSLLNIFRRFRALKMAKKSRVVFANNSSYSMRTGHFSFSKLQRRRKKQVF